MRLLVLTLVCLLAISTGVTYGMSVNAQAAAASPVSGAHGKGQNASAANGTGDAEPQITGSGNGNGISAQVHEIVEARKNGSIIVPQGMLVSIIAKNHTMSVAEAVLELNETINASVIVNGRNRTLRLEPDTDTINITDGNVTVYTNETLDIENDTLSVSGMKVLLMPSEVPGKIRAKTIKSAVLHVVNGDPLYEVNSTRGAKVLWIFDADMDVETTLDAATGQIKNEKRPWWSFLASED